MTVLPVSKSPNVRTPLRETVALGRELRFCGVEKQQDRTVQKLMMADGRRDEPVLIFLNSFPEGEILRRKPDRGGGLLEGEHLLFGSRTVLLL